MKRGREMDSVETVSWFIPGIVGPVFLIQESSTCNANGSENRRDKPSHKYLSVLMYLKHIATCKTITTFERKGILICTLKICHLEA